MYNYINWTIWNNINWSTVLLSETSLECYVFWFFLQVVPYLLKFLDNLTNIYVRFNRKRLKGRTGEQDCRTALSTLYHVSLLTLSSLRLMCQISYAALYFPSFMHCHESDLKFVLWLCYFLCLIDFCYIMYIFNNLIFCSLAGCASFWISLDSDLLWFCCL